MNVGVLGSGAVGKVLAQGCVKYGMKTCIGSRTPEKLRDFANGVKGLEVATQEETAEFGDIVILAVKGEIAQAVVTSLAKQLEGKVVIDCTNPIDPDNPAVDGVLNYLEFPQGMSLMEHLQDTVPGARFVKAFNSVGNNYMVDPKFKDGNVPTMFICGNDDQAKADTTNLLKTFGWQVADMGKARSARPIESLCILWCARGFNSNKWNHAFKLLSDD